MSLEAWGDDGGADEPVHIDQLIEAGWLDPDEVTALRAELAEAKKDAERYRFIRASENARGTEPYDYLCNMWAAIVSVDTSPEGMDAAIDAALAAQEKREQ